MTNAKIPAETALVARFTAEAMARLQKAASAGFPVAALSDAVARICAIPTEEKAAVPLLAKRKIDAAFFGALHSLSASLTDARAGQPVNLAHMQLLTDADRATLDEAFQTLSVLRQSAVEVAENADKDAAAKAFGRGERIANNAKGLQKALGNFLTAATPERMDLLADAGIDVDDLTQLNDLHQQVTAIAGQKAARKGKKAAVARYSDLYSLAIVQALHVFRARARLALSKNPVLLVAVLERLPRRPERRGGGKKPVAPAQE